MLLTRLAMFLLVVTYVAKPSLTEEYTLDTFTRQQLTDVYYSEGASVGDVNNDDVADVVYGPYWFAGPNYETKQEI